MGWLFNALITAGPNVQVSRNNVNLLIISWVNVNVAAIIVIFINNCLQARESNRTVEGINTWSILPPVTCTGNPTGFGELSYAPLGKPRAAFHQVTKRQHGQWVWTGSYSYVCFVSSSPVCAVCRVMWLGLSVYSPISLCLYYGFLCWTCAGRAAWKAWPHTSHTVALNPCDTATPPPPLKSHTQLSMI